MCQKKGLQGQWSPKITSSSVESAGINIKLLKLQRQTTEGLRQGTFIIQLLKLKPGFLFQSAKIHMHDHKNSCSSFGQKIKTVIII